MTKTLLYRFTTKSNIGSSVKTYFSHYTRSITSMDCNRKSPHFEGFIMDNLYTHSKEFMFLDTNYKQLMPIPQAYQL